MSDKLFKEFFTEFLGTFLFVFLGGMAVAQSASTESLSGYLMAALTFGFVFVGLYYIFAACSGAHFNPAVSFGFFVTGQMSFMKLLIYWVAQILGAITAGALIMYFVGTESVGGYSTGVYTNSDYGKTIFLEAIITFFLVMAYLVLYRNPTMSLFSGLMIGLIIAAITLAAGYYTGGSANPARSIGTSIFNGLYETCWLYVVGPFVGALIAAIIYVIFSQKFGAKYVTSECGDRAVDACGNYYKYYETDVVDKCGNKVYETVPEIDCYGNVSKMNEVPKKKQVVFVDHKHGFKPHTMKDAFEKEVYDATGMKFDYIKQEVGNKVSSIKSSIPIIRDGKSELMGDSLGSKTSNLLGSRSSSLLNNNGASLLNNNGASLLNNNGSTNPLSSMMSSLSKDSSNLIGSPFGSTANNGSVQNSITNGLLKTINSITK